MELFKAAEKAKLAEYGEYWDFEESGVQVFDVTVVEA